VSFPELSIEVSPIFRLCCSQLSTLNYQL
jgi:hypothetical protein